MSKALITLSCMAMVAYATAVCEYKPYKASGEFKNIDAIRFQTLDKAHLIVDENIEHPVIDLYASNEIFGLSTLNTAINDGELTVGAANNDRSQCVEVRLPSNFDVDTIIADDSATVELHGIYTVPYLKLHIVNGFFVEANSSNTNILVDYLVVNNTGVGSVLFDRHDDSISDLEIENQGNGDTMFMGSVGDVVVRHHGMGNLQLGEVTGTLEVSMSGQGDIAVEGSSTLEILGRIKHPYQVLYEDANKCDLEAILGNDIYNPCKMVTDVEDSLAVALAGR